MLRLSIVFALCVAMVLTETIGYAQVDRSQHGLLADYFAEVEQASTEGIVNPDLEQRRLNSAVLYLRQGQFREAIRDCIRVLERFVNHPKGMVILGMASKLVKEPTLPIPYYERALQLYPQRALTQAQYGKYLAEIGKIEDGVARLRRAIEIDPKLDPAYVWLARIYVQNRQSDLARQVLQRRKEVETAEATIPNVVSRAKKGEHQGRDENTIGDFSEDPSVGNKTLGDKGREEGVFPEEKNEETTLYPLQER
jgi:tetratricopeptide (TPR) repeat protein